ncbi:MAG: SemiSWEET family transporter [Neisseria sp.]
MFAAVSCLIWVLYGWSKEPRKDWILIIPNAVGVILGFLTFLTSL